MNSSRPAESMRHHLSRANKTFERLASHAKTTTILAALAAVGAQGCATEELAEECASLRRSAVQQIEVDVGSTARVTANELQLCVRADNYDDCETLAQTGDSNTYTVTYLQDLKDVVSIHLRVASEESSLASQISQVAVEKGGAAVGGEVAIAAEGQQLEPVASVDIEDVVVVAVTDEGRELIFAVAGNTGRTPEFAVAPVGTSDHEFASCER